MTNICLGTYSIPTEYGKPKTYKGEVGTSKGLRTYDPRDKLINRPFGIGEVRSINEGQYRNNKTFLVNDTGFWKDRPHGVSKCF